MYIVGKYIIYLYQL